jgi:hypothetical protein
MARQGASESPIVDRTVASVSWLLTRRIVPQEILYFFLPFIACDFFSINVVHGVAVKSKFQELVRLTCNDTSFKEESDGWFISCI